MNTRAHAAHIISTVTGGGKSLSGLLDACPPNEDRPLLQELCYGVIRHWYRLDAIAGRLLDKPLKHKDGDVHALLLVGLYQLIYMRVPPHAAVSETVAATRGLRKVWSKNLVNALLRKYLRESEQLLTLVDSDPQAASLTPDWLLQRLQQAWPGQWQAVVAASNARAPMSLRVNLDCGDRDFYLARLANAQIPARRLEHTEGGIQLEVARDVHELPGFEAGDVSVQDAAAQLAAPLLDAQGGERILDACAAPGGKTAHILERLAAAGQQAEVTALDVDADRLQRVEATLARLGLQARVSVGDAAIPAGWWDGQPYDRVLLDAPCSATGVIRRHPDIRLLRRDTDIAQLAANQQRILSALWQVLKPGGRLLYATCSILPEENADTIKAFLARQDDARLLPIDADWGLDTGYGRQILPGERDMDGFFYARLEKSA